MHLASVDIKNFRSLKDLTLDLQPGLNVLVGRNNTGKTNLLQAIRHAIGRSASRGEGVWLDRDDFYRSAPDTDPESSMSVTLTFAELSEAQRAHFYEIVDFDLANLANSKAIVRFDASWPKGKKHPSVKRTGGPRSAEQPEIPTPLLESLPVTFLPALRDAEAALAPGYRKRASMRNSSTSSQGSRRSCRTRRTGADIRSPVYTSTSSPQRTRITTASPAALNPIRDTRLVIRIRRRSEQEHRAGDPARRSRSLMIGHSPRTAG